MKKFTLFFVNARPTLDQLNKIRNSLFTSDIKNIEKKYISCIASHYDSERKIEIKLIDLFDNTNFNNFDNETINILIYKSFLLAKKIKVDYMPTYTNERKDAIFSTIESCLIKLKHSKNDIFYFCSDIFFKLLVTHKLINGNKRIATSILINFLYYFGYYFKFQSEDYVNYRDWEEKCIHFIKRSESKEKDDKIINDIRKWILKNIVIAYYFR